MRVRRGSCDDQRERAKCVRFRTEYCQTVEGGRGGRGCLGVKQVRNVVMPSLGVADAMRKWQAHARRRAIGAVPSAIKEVVSRQRCRPARSRCGMRDAGVRVADYWRGVGVRAAMRNNAMLRRGGSGLGLI